MTPLTLVELQEQHEVWQQKNFPRQQSYQAILGAIEELGELAHAHLKEEQAIRQMDADKAFDLKCDAIGDLFIFLAGYCNLEGIDMQNALETTWAKVKTRDWIADPEGKTA